LILTCQTGRGILIGSGAVEDDFLILGKLAKPGLKVVQGNGSLQAHAPTGLFAVIGAHQETLTSLHPGVNLFWRNTQDL
jgi:hypothetical protein